jgi:hypothetical protein
MRKPNWHIALADYLRSCESARFEYGRMDCGLFVAGAIQAVSGIDVAEAVRGTYATRTQAFARIGALCGARTVEAVAVHLAARYGLREVGVAFAQRGDPVLLKHGRASRLGLIAMYGTEILAPGRVGLLRFPLDRATRAWHI